MDIEKYAGNYKKSSSKKKPLELVQPNKVTNARYHFTEREENILTLMIDAIQKHVTKERPIQTDLFNQPLVRIDTKELGDKTKKKYLDACNSLRKKDFSFEWTRKKDGRLIKSDGSFVSTVHNIKETPYIEITLNVWAIPYLLYWGKGVGGTIFSKATALKLPGNYTKRLYKICKRWEDVGGFSMSLDEFRDMLMLENKYPKIKDLKRWVLDIAANRMKEMADIYFTYSLEKVAGSRSYNFIHFAVHSNDKNRAGNKKSDMYVFIYTMLSIAYPVMKSSRARDIADHLSQDNEAFEKLYFRLKGIRNDYESGKIEHVDVVRLIKHIIKKDYGL
jgi:plasmid replication initiation protein